jgi:LPS-assembly protein
MFSLDSGLVFERQINSKNQPITQTLEPRLFYLYVPYKDQDNLIVDESGNDVVFDTSQPAFSMSHLYRENRYSGGDRVGDANQLNAALTSRLLDRRGRELIRVSAGRIFYFRDREVTLPGGQVETQAESDWVAEASSHWLKSLSAKASLQWDADNEHMQRSSAHIVYKKDPRRVLKLAYRYEKTSQEQGDIAFMWPVANRWNIIGRWLHSLKDDVTLESLKGVEYESCCWTARIVQQKYRINTIDDNESDSIWFQLELKGLTSLGRSVKDLLERDILSQ